MSAVEVDIAEAIKDELNNYDFGQSFTATRNYSDVATKLETLDQLIVDVVPWSSESSLEDRGELTYTVLTDILIRRRFGMPEQETGSGEIDTDEIDALMELRQKIGEYFTPSQVTGQDGRRLTDQPNAAWQETKTMAAYVRPHLRQFRQFTGWLRITYQICRAAGS